MDLATVFTTASGHPGFVKHVCHHPCWFSKSFIMRQSMQRAWYYHSFFFPIKKPQPHSCQIVYVLTKNNCLGNFGRALEWKALEYFMAVWSILQSFGLSFGKCISHLVYFFSILVCCTKKNLATLLVCTTSVNFKKLLLGHFCKFQKAALRKQSPNRRKFALSGHPGSNPTIRSYNAAL
jgi:hypothetical protein